MRVVTGKFKGQEIFSPPKSIELRPTSDRVREAVFDVLRFDIAGATFLDLFAGSGAVGIEAISEGASFAVFVEKNQVAVRTINANIRKFGIENKTLLLKEDVLRFLTLRKMPEVFRNTRFNIVFLDPPYASKLATQTLLALTEFNTLEEEAIIVAEHEEKEILKEEYSGSFALKRFKEKTYGKIVVSYFIVNKG